MAVTQNHDYAISILRRRQDEIAKEMADMRREGADGYAQAHQRFTDLGNAIAELVHSNLQRPYWTDRY